MSDLYFAYGSNLDTAQMLERCPGSRAMFRAQLSHHRLDFTHFSTRWNGGAADVVPHSGASVWGLVYALTAHDLDLLDQYEGGYQRILLEVLDDGGGAHVATTYVVEQKHSFRPSAVYIEKMIRAAIEWDFPAPYVESLKLYR